MTIIGMSATMPNMLAVTDWIHGNSYINGYRPVPLIEYFVIGECIYDKEMNK